MRMLGRVRVIVVVVPFWIVRMVMAMFMVMFTGMFVGVLVWMAIGIQMDMSTRTGRVLAG
jgi:hypothetical protein